MNRLRYPRLLLPACSRASFTSDTTPVKLGAAQLVPATDVVNPLYTISNCSAGAATSGMPAPVWLNRDLSGTSLATAK